VEVNGRPAGCTWTPPHRLDVTELVSADANRLTFRVTNTWFNRLVHDAGLEEAERKTWTISGPSENEPLLPAGLLGPVVLRTGQVLDT